VLVSGNRIAAVGPKRSVAARRGYPTLDLGDAILLPGLVNAHCHLDYTNMAGQFMPPRTFTDWLKLITTAKGGWTSSDYAESWLAGANMLARNGVTTVGDIEAFPELLPEMWNATPLRVFSFLEMIGITLRREPADILRAAEERIASLANPRCWAGLSPHAPYSTLPELIRLSAKTAREHGWRTCTHVAESALEFEMFARARGEMFDWLKRSGRDISDCGKGSPVQHLERCGLLNHRLLATHANYLGRADVALLAKRRVSVVHCPRSHHFFGHRQFPLRKLLRAGVNVCLGTDSLASVHIRRRQPVELNLFEDMRVLAYRQPWLSPARIVEMATLNGARALGLQNRIGHLSRGAFADLIAIPFAGKLSAAPSAILEHEGAVAASMIDGKWVVPPRAEKP
jgi:cytosine/adenosine deaminase-related metal-dependent hydrolase